MLSETQGKVVASQSDSPANVRYVANRPIAEERANASREWFGLPSIFKLCSHGSPQTVGELTDRGTTEASPRADALIMLRQLSGE